ncbi:MAG TPA: hypothetical protein VHY84_01815 [Bryobacteraceae bacterium]|jgi:hypothetical protein|nr:hypothetical protein [Bryobacteraceae bacterium]
MTASVLSSEPTVHKQDLSCASGDVAAAMIRSLYCGLRPGEKRVSVFVAYSDEASAGGNATDEFLVAGYVAREDEWPCFAKAWQERALDESSDGPKIQCFHMTQMRSRAWRELHGLSDTSARRRTEEALRTIHGSGFVLPVASAINQTELREIIQDKFKNAGKKVPAGLDEPDYFCHLAFCYIALQDIAERFPDAEKVNFYFAKKRNKISANLITIAEHTRKWLERERPSLAPLMGSAIPAEPELFLPLQAADVICWYLQRYHTDYRKGKRFDYEFSDHLMVVIKEKFERLQLWTRESLESMAHGLDKINWDEENA